MRIVQKGSNQTSNRSLSKPWFFNIFTTTFTLPFRTGAIGDEDPESIQCLHKKSEHGSRIESGMVESESLSRSKAEYRKKSNKKNVEIQVRICMNKFYISVYVMLFSMHVHAAGSAVSSEPMILKTTRMILDRSLRETVICYIFNQRDVNQQPLVDYQDNEL